MTKTEQTPARIGGHGATDPQHPLQAGAVPHPPPPPRPERPGPTAAPWPPAETASADPAPVVETVPETAPTARPEAPEPAMPHPETPTATPVAPRARMRRRHWGIALSFIAAVLVPLAAIAAYLYLVAEDQYASSTGFTVRSEEASAATDIFGGLAGLAAPGGGGDAQILFEFISSQDMVQRLDDQLDLVGHYSAPHATDPVFALAPDAAIEDLVEHWQQIVDVSFDRGAGLLDLRVLAFDPAMAQRVAEAIVAESQVLVNQLNDQARADSMRFAQADLDAALLRLRDARAALTEFRSRTQIVDPETDLQGRMGVLNILQQQLAEAWIEVDVLASTTSPSDPRLEQARARIRVIEDRIVQERLTFTQEQVGQNGEDYPTLMAEYEGLFVDREFAEQSYRAALAALDLARTNAERQSRYLAVFVQPTLSETSLFPQREVIVGLAALFLLLGWAVVVLIVYSIRDRD